MHGQREPKQAPWLSVFPDGVTGVKVEGEHRCWEQKVRKQVTSSGAASLQQHRRAVQISPVCSKLGPHPGAALGSVWCRLTAATPLPKPGAALLPHSAPSGHGRQQRREFSVLQMCSCGFIYYMTCSFSYNGLLICHSGGK